MEYFDFLMSEMNIVFRIKGLEGLLMKIQTMTFLYPNVNHNIMMSY